MTKQYDLGQLETVKLCTIWSSENRDFTPWLSRSENLKILGETIGIELELVETESRVGPFRADIVAEEVGTGRKVIIENQYKTSDHNHLGKTITYAAGKDAQACIWIVEDARDEHRRAVEWLNQHTDSELGFFLVEIQLWKIGNSKPAPYFRVVEWPNDWAKAMEKFEELSETKQVRFLYWTKYYDLAHENPNFMTYFNPQEPSTDSYSSLKWGNSKYYINLLIDPKKKCIGIELYVPNAKEIGREAISSKERFEKALQLEANTHNPDKKKLVRIQFFEENCDTTGKKEHLPEFIDKQPQWATEMKKVIDELEL